MGSRTGDVRWRTDEAHLAWVQGVKTTWRTVDPDAASYLQWPSHASTCHIQGPDMIRLASRRAPRSQDAGTAAHRFHRRGFAPAGLDTAALGRQMAQRQKILNDDVARIGAQYSTAGAVTRPVVSCVLMA
jgi:hypothetical protein